MPTPGIKSRIDRFLTSLTKLERISKIDFKRFKDESDLRDIAERNLHVAIEALIDVGEFLISQGNWRVPKSYRDVASILSENGVIDERLRKAFDDLIALRNIIVHNYVYLEPEVLYTYVRKYGILNEIMKNFFGYMNRNNIDP